MVNKSPVVISVSIWLGSATSAWNVGGARESNHRGGGQERRLEREGGRQKRMQKSVELQGTQRQALLNMARCVGSSESQHTVRLRAAACVLGGLSSFAQVG